MFSQNRVFSYSLFSLKNHGEQLFDALSRRRAGRFSRLRRLTFRRFAIQLVYVAAP
jgi:hypothetical protein